MKSKLEITDLAALEDKFPQCVETTTKIIKKPVHENIRAALKLYGEVPGVRVIEGSEPVPEKPQEHGKKKLPFAHAEK